MADLGAFGAPLSAAMGIAKSLGLGVRIDPALAHSFSVEIDGLLVGGFTEVDGLKVDTQLETIPEGGQNEWAEQRVKGITYPPLVLKRGITTADMLWMWHQDVLAGNIKRRDGSIVLMTTDITELWRWNFKAAYPVSWVGPQFRADQANVAFESITLAHRGISKDLAVMGLASGAISVGASLF